MKDSLNYEGWELTFFDEATNFRNYQIDILKKYLRGTIAEIGPGNGSLCEKYSELGEKIFLFEPSSNLYENLVLKFNKKKNIEIINKEFHVIEKKFDSIILMDVIEHISNPSDLIQKLYKSLSENGTLLINVPAFQHLYSDFDKDVGHIKRYNKFSFFKELGSIPSKNVKMFYYDFLGYFLSLFSKVLFFFTKNFGADYKKNFREKIIIWNKFIPISKVLDKIFFNKLGKSLFVIIKK